MNTHLIACIKKELEIRNNLEHAILCFIKICNAHNIPSVNTIDGIQISKFTCINNNIIDNSQKK